MTKNNSNKTSNDNKYIVAGSIFILLIFTLVIYLMSNTYALDEFGNINISCDKGKIKKNDIVSCTITGNVIAGAEVSSLEMQANTSENLEILSFTKDSSWEGDEESGNIQLYTDINKENTFAIGILQIKVKNTISNVNENIELNNIVFYKGANDNYEGVSIDGKEIEFNTETTTENINIIIDEEEKIIYKIPLSTTYNEVISNIEKEGTITIKDKNNQDVSLENIAKTGEILSVTINNETTTYKISVLGDPTGDGLLLINDVGKAYQYLKKRLNMPKECVLAAEVTKDGEVLINDVGKMFQYLKGKLNSLG